MPPPCWAHGQAAPLPRDAGSGVWHETLVHSVYFTVSAQPTAGTIMRQQQQVQKITIITLFKTMPRFEIISLIKHCVRKEDNSGALSAAEAFTGREERPAGWPGRCPPWEVLSHGLVHEA